MISGIHVVSHKQACHDYRCRPTWIGCSPPPLTARSSFPACARVTSTPHNSTQKRAELQVSGRGCNRRDSSASPRPIHHPLSFALSLVSFEVIAVNCSGLREMSTSSPSACSGKEPLAQVVPLGKRATAHDISACPFCRSSDPERLCRPDSHRGAPATAVGAKQGTGEAGHCLP